MSDIESIRDYRSICFIAYKRVISKISTIFSIVVSSKQYTFENIFSSLVSERDTSPWNNFLGLEKKVLFSMKYIGLAPVVSQRQKL